MFYRNEYKEKIKELIKQRYELRNIILKGIKDSEIYDEIRPLVENRIIQGDVENYDHKIENIV